MVWRWKGPRRVQPFLWLAIHGRLLTNERKQRIIGSNPSCYRYLGVTKSLMHVLRDCEVAWSLWIELLEGQIEPEFMTLQGKDWFTWNLEKKQRDCDMRFGLTCWLLWSWRNKVLFEDGFMLPENRKHIVEWYVREIKRARAKFGRVIGLREEKLIRWESPGEGWVKINIDGASRGPSQLAGCGSLIRGSDGQWICGFAKKLGRCSAIRAELWAVLTGLELAVCRKFYNVIVECDSLAVIHMLNNLQVKENAGARLLFDIAVIIGKFSGLVFVHVFREGNKCADALANASFVQEDANKLFDSPPAVIDTLLYRNYVGISYPRSVCVNEMKMG